jgi:hypothetical protein
MIELDGYRQVEGPEAHALADAGGELMDLRFVDDAIGALLITWPAETVVGPDTTQARALWVAAVVWYARCFTGGRRTSRVAAGLVDALSDEARATHKYVLALRNRHMAHSINVFEQVIAGVRLGPAPDYLVEGLEPLGLMMVLPTRERAVGVQLLTRELMALMAPKLQELGRTLNGVLTAMNPGQRGRLKPVMISPPLTTTDPSVARKQRPIKRPSHY